VSAESTSKEEEGHLKHDRKALNEEVEWPLLESITFVLTVSTTLDHRPTRIPQVTVEPLFPQHCDKCSQQRDQETCIHESGGGDYLAGRDFLDGWNSGGFIWDSVTIFTFFTQNFLSSKRPVQIMTRRYLILSYLILSYLSFSFHNSKSHKEDRESR